MVRALIFQSLFILSTFLAAQPSEGQRFAAFAYAGPTLAQIDGDYYFGYNKFGARFGVGAHVLGTPKWYGSVSLGFSQGGLPTGSLRKV